MSTHSSILGTLVTNTDSAYLPGPGPLIGKHVRLERSTVFHIPELYEYVGSRAELWTWWPVGPFDSLVSYSEYLTTLQTTHSSNLAIYTISLPSGPHAEKAIGLAFIQSSTPTTHRVAEIGLFYGPYLQRTVAGTEAVYLLCKAVFETNHRRFQWKTNALNWGSRRAAERYGFVFEGVWRQDMLCKGRNRDSAWFSMLDGEWDFCKEVFQLWLAEENFDEEGGQRKRIEVIREQLKTSEGSV